MHLVPTESLSRPNSRGYLTFDYATGSGVLLAPCDWTIQEGRAMYSHLASLGWDIVPVYDFHDVSTDGRTVIRMLCRADGSGDYGVMSPALKAGLPESVFNVPRIIGDCVAIAFDLNAGVVCVPWSNTDEQKKLDRIDMLMSEAWLWDEFCFGVSNDPLSMDDYYESSGNSSPAGFNEYPAVWGLRDKLPLAA